MRSASIWPLTGRTGGRRSGGSPAIVRDQAPAASTTISAALGRAVFKYDAGGPAALHGNLLDRPMLVNCHAGRFGGDAQRLHELAVIDLMVLRREQGASDFSRQMRLPLSRVRGRQPFERQVEMPLKLQAMRDFRLIVRGQGEHQRALAPQFDVDATRAQQLFGKGRPARLAVAAERDQRFLARLGFAACRQHAGCGMACAGSGLAAVEYRNRCPAGEPPGDAQADNASANDGDVRLFADMGEFGPSEAAPFAGMTQTGSMGLISADASK